MKTILGIDAGSVAVSVAVLEENGEILKTDYAFHKGAVKETLLEMLRKLELTEVDCVAVTTTSPDFFKDVYRYNNQMSMIASIKSFHPLDQNVLVVGGENFGLLRFSKLGEYESYKSNTACAAGTGSFLDQQAGRLRLAGIEQLAQIANDNKEKTPRIATRCAVFAKTDLIHAQQEGYSLAQICDGLCEGLVNNIADTLFSERSFDQPVVFAGGVSRNPAVVKHLTRILGIEPIVGEYSHIYGAIGTAMLAMQEKVGKPADLQHPESLFAIEKRQMKATNEPLTLKLSDYPDFGSIEKKEYRFKNREKHVVESDIYEEFLAEQEAYIGIDIGSTSTKAILIDPAKKTLAGFYTRTAGQPLQATQAIFETIDEVARQRGTKLKFLGAGTTGSGRQFIGKIVGADMMIDEITAHARAAYELDPEVDTIIEIGGQDSKFTTLKNGMVTFSIMNNVCAAGTGSFIEEQASKLGCSLTDYSERVEQERSPLSSDRCTVFMERDLNYYLAEGYTTDQILASVLHSVRDNYMLKVAVEANIGNKVFFQGATAKNKALVAAFEQKLNKPILVSQFCHLTGALGAALIVLESKSESTRFRGIELYKEDIPVESEVCTLCHNNCKIKKITVRDEIVTFGFLCGRDYDTKKFVESNQTGFDLLRVVKSIRKATNVPKQFKLKTTIGIPGALYLKEETAFWQHFFNSLGIETVVVENLKDAIKTGKSISKAEFCAPISAFFGYVKHTALKADYVFLPFYMDSKEKDKSGNRLYCYYTQFAPSLAATNKQLDIRERTLMPVIDPFDIFTKLELAKTLKPIFNTGYWDVSFAYDSAMEFGRETKAWLESAFLQETENTDELGVVLLGRPYSILDTQMNKHIPDLFSKHNIKTFYQDMIPYTPEEMSEIAPLLKAVHWNFASKILCAALVAAKTDGLYPVYVTSFKCGPDSFAIEYFKRIMDFYGKPYLILELDEHGSNVGYETRIEAAIRSFGNHKISAKSGVRTGRSAVIFNPQLDNKLEGKTLLLPSWDDMTSVLFEAVLRKEGIDARTVRLTEQSIRRGTKTNTGQCLPVNIAHQSFIDYIEENNLDPAKVSVWMLNMTLSCNITMYPYLLKSMFESYGKGMELLTVYPGDLALMDISLFSVVDSYFAHQFAGQLRKMGCKIRPYEKNKGETNQAVNESMQVFYDSFLGKISRDDAVVKVVERFKRIETVKTDRPLVAVFGDIYVRDNDMMNQNLIEYIEEAGGEVITTPLSDMVKMFSDLHFKRMFNHGMITDMIALKGILLLIEQLEKGYKKHFNEVLQEPVKKTKLDVNKVLSTFQIKADHSGESLDNLLKVTSLLDIYPDISLFVQTSPAFCCAGIVTEAMSEQIEEATGVPVVSLTYDGTGKKQNEKVIPYIKYPRRHTRAF